MRKRDPRHIITYFSSFFDLKKMVENSGRNIVFPFYHAVNDNPGPHLRHLYPIKSVKDFEEDLDKILKYFTPVSPAELFNPRSKTKKTGFVISFDDGLREVYEIIAPILNRKGITAVFFLNNNFIDNKDMFYRYKVSLIIDKIENGNINEKLVELIRSKTRRYISVKNNLKRFVLDLNHNDKKQIDSLCHLLELDPGEYLNSRKPYMTISQINELIDKGFYIGAHSYDHPEFFNLESSQQLNEIKMSIVDIRNQFDLDYSLFAFPFTDYGVSREVLSFVHHDLDLKPLATFGTSGIANNPTLPHYQRLSMEKYKGNSERIFSTEYLYNRMKKIVGRA